MILQSMQYNFYVLSQGFYVVILADLYLQISVFKLPPELTPTIKYNIIITIMKISNTLSTIQLTLKSLFMY